MIKSLLKTENVCKALITKSSSLDLVETPAKFYVRSLGQYFGGGMAFVNSTKLKTRLFRARRAQCGVAAPRGFVCAWFVECGKHLVLDGIDPLSRKHGPEIYLVSLNLYRSLFLM